jgi:hypothetical protein
MSEPPSPNAPDRDEASVAPDPHPRPTTPGPKLIQRLLRPLIFGLLAVLIAFVVLPTFTGGQSERAAAERLAAQQLQGIILAEPDLFGPWNYEISRTDTAPPHQPSLTIRAKPLQADPPPAVPDEAAVRDAIAPVSEYAAIRFRYVDGADTRINYRFPITRSPQPSQPE